MTRLIDAYDAALFDLDGVVYLGPLAIDGVPEALSDLRASGIKVAFVTNNAGRSVATVVEHLRSLGIECHSDDVVTSAQAITQVMARHLPPAAPVLVCGAQSLADEVLAAGLTPVPDYTCKPVAVVQGYDPAMTWPRLDDACFAIQHGARWYVSNTDLTRPTHLGLVPGAGAQVNAVAQAVDADPTIAGKPYPPLLEATVERIGAKLPLFVGDRLDTDIEGAINVGMDSFFVFTGAHGLRDLLRAQPAQRPTAIGYDVADLAQPARQCSPDFSCGAARVLILENEAQLTGPMDTRDQQLDAAWALCQAAWTIEGLRTEHLIGLFTSLY